MTREERCVRGADEEMARLLGPFWSEGKTRRSLGGQAGAIASVEQVRRLALALPTSDGLLVYPVWQFEEAGAGVRIIPALLPLLETLSSHDPWAVATLLCTPAPEFDGFTPRCVIGKVGSAELVAFARQVDREWSLGAGAP